MPTAWMRRLRCAGILLAPLGACTTKVDTSACAEPATNRMPPSLLDDYDGRVIVHGSDLAPQWTLLLDPEASGNRVIFGDGCDQQPTSALLQAHLVDGEAVSSLVTFEFARPSYGPSLVTTVVAAWEPSVDQLDVLDAFIRANDPSGVELGTPTAQTSVTFDVVAQLLSITVYYDGPSGSDSIQRGSFEIDGLSFPARLE